MIVKVNAAILVNVARLFFLTFQMRFCLLCVNEYFELFNVLDLPVGDTEMQMKMNVLSVF